MRVLVCGSRAWIDQGMIDTILEGLCTLAAESTLVIIEGGAKGADACAANFAKQADQHWVEHEQYPANWETFGRSAGVIRNAQMLKEGKPDLVVAFTDNLAISLGTKNMVEQAEKAGVPVWVIGHGPGYQPPQPTVPSKGV